MQKLDYEEVVGSYFFKFPTWELADGRGLRMLYGKRQNVSCLINHSKQRANVLGEEQTIKGEPCMVYYALRDIVEDEELFEDYGYAGDKVLEDLFPWILE